MKRVQWLGFILGLVLLLGMGTWLASKFEWVEEKAPREMRGEAKTDPYFALRLLIVRLGYRTEVINDPSLLIQQPISATIVALKGYPSLVGQRIEPQLVEWIKRGGHLVVSVDAHPGEFLGELGLVPYATQGDMSKQGLMRKETRPTRTLTMEGRALEVRLLPCPVFNVAGTPTWWATVKGYTLYKKPADTDKSDKDEASRFVDEDAIVAARWPLGKGRVTAICSGFPLRNQIIEDASNAELAARVVLDERNGPVIFAPRPEYPTLGEWLLEYAWSALIAIALLLLLGLWHVMPRFGPIALELKPVRPGLRQHLRAVGTFHLRKHQYTELLQASRDAMMRLAERHAGTTNVKLAEIAAFAGVVESDLQQAFHSNPQDRAGYLRQATVLAKASDALQAARPLSSSTSRSKKS